mmetsp:Transcript_3892/g.5955  ORF Transcript_3892/g.5955 Transcript_3892/m.5955 type:complete len:123 (+) Transcript_3892:30-398(+)
MVAVKPPTKSKKPKVKVARFEIDCSIPVNDNVLDPLNFEKYLHDRIKVNGKTGNLGTNIVIKRKNHKITIEARVPFSKSCLKFYTKKYLKKQSLRDYVRIIAKGKSTYLLKYYAVNEEKAEG